LSTSLANAESSLQLVDQRISYQEDSQLTREPDQLSQASSLYGQSSTREHKVVTLGDVVVYDFTLQSMSGLVDSSLFELEPCWRATTGEPHLAHMLSSTEWRQKFTTVVDNMLIGLAQGQSKTIGILTPFVNNEYGGNCLEWDLQQLSYHVCFL
jgi:hypothetical protein